MSRSDSLSLPQSDERAALAVARGIGRLFARNDVWCLAEMPLRSGRRADLMGIDAKGQVLGKLATKAAVLLTGKHKPVYTPLLDTGDPVIVADSLGNFYMGILAYSGSGNGILVAKSTDGGATWAEPVRLDNGGDKEYMVVDYRNDTVYTVWENTGAAFNQGLATGYE